MKDLTFLTNQYKNLLIDSTKIHSGTISTVDHIYASPPLRLVDSHSKLKALGNVQIVIWDITIPFEKKHRYELILDSGLFSSKNKNYYLFDLNKYYFQSELHKVDLIQQRNELEFVLNRTLPLEGKLKYLERFDELVKIYENAVSMSHNAIEFYRILVCDLYSLISLKDLGVFFYENSISLFHSGLLESYLPQIIEDTRNQEFSFINLLENTLVFKSPYFRSLEPDIDLNFENKKEVIKHLDTIVSLLKAKKIIPSNQVILWSLQLAGIKHFGNDFNFHDSMHSTMNKLSIKNNINSLQLTLPKQDGTNFIEFDKVKSYHVQQYQDRKRVVATPTKKSRVNDITNAYLHLGDKVHDYWDDYHKTGKAEYIPMGKIL